MIVLLILTFFFADSVLTPLILILWKKIWFLLLKAKALLTKKNIVQALVQSVLLAAKALMRLVNKTIAVWVLPSLMTRRQRYRLHHAMINARMRLRRRMLRLWIRWRKLPLWLKVLALGPVMILTLAFFIGSGLLLASLFGVTFIVPWIGGLPVAFIVFFRRALARLGLFVFERMGMGVVVNRLVNWTIELAWWKTPERLQRRFDVWWRRFKLRMRRRVIGPRRRVARRIAGFRSTRASGKNEPTRSEREPPGTTGSSKPQRG